MKIALCAADRLNLRIRRLLLVAMIAIAGLGAGLGVGYGQLVQTASAGPQKLLITILDGDNALNNIRQRDAREPIVQVTDENHKPVAGALILFSIHNGANGAGASFPGGATSLSVTTGPDGIAHAVGLSPQGSGKYTITVAASVGALVALEVIIHQSNVITPLNAGSASAKTGPGSEGGANSASTNPTSKIKKFFHSTPGKLLVGGATVAAVTVVLVTVTSNSSTSLTLGASSVTHP